jgi:hypothetical protein
MSCFDDPEYVALWSEKTKARLVELGMIDAELAKKVESKPFTGASICTFVNTGKKHFRDDKYGIERKPQNKPKNKHLADPEKRAALEEMIRKRVKIVDVVKAFGGDFTIHNVEYVKRIMDIPKVNGQPFTATENKMLEMKNRGVKPMQISTTLKVPHSEVTRFMARVKDLKRRGKKI